MTDTDNIKVYVRFRPTSVQCLKSPRARDTSPNHYQIINNSQTVDLVPQKIPRRPINNTILDHPNGTSATLTSIDSSRSCKFTFDHVFPYHSTQNEIFEFTIEPILHSIMQGYNASIICYGQTGSGKTYTMMGDYDDDEHCGIIPRLFTNVFKEIENAPDTSQYTIALSYFEIYNDTINDLLNPGSDLNQIYIRESSSNDWKPTSRKNSSSSTNLLSSGNNSNDDLTMSNDPTIYVEGLDKFYVADIEDINQVLKIGNSNRAIAETKMNSSSSRSHSILRVEITVHEYDSNKEEKMYTSTLFLVDLAGSERLNKSGTNSSHTSLKETIGINSSLSALGNVINLLGSDSNIYGKKPLHIPYRDSKLTRVLANSLGGNSKTAMIVTCSSELNDFNETLSTLRFAQRAKNVHNIITKNETIISNTIPQQMKQFTKISSNDDMKNWKSRYVNALKKIVDLEARIEAPGYNNALSNDIEYSNNLEQLKKENSGMREELDIYKKIVNDFQNDQLKESLDITLTLKSLESLKADVEIYKKLLVTKTDHIIQLEDQLEEYKNGNLNINSHEINEDEQDSINTMKTMSDTIQSQNHELLKQVERAEQLLLKKEKDLERANLKWLDRDHIVTQEQKEVEKKLEEMNERLKHAIDGASTGNANSINNHNYTPSNSNSHLNDNYTHSSSTAAAAAKKGVNLHIIKPR